MMFGPTIAGAMTAIAGITAAWTGELDVAALFCIAAGVWALVAKKEGR